MSSANTSETGESTAATPPTVADDVRMKPGEAARSRPVTAGVHSPCSSNSINRDSAAFRSVQCVTRHPALQL